MGRRVRDRDWRQNRDHGHGGVIGGVILAGIGVVLLLQNLGIPFFQDLERYWPVILIVVGLAQVSRAMGMEKRLWGGAVFVVGIVFLLSNFGIIHGNIWRFLFPGFLIMVGLALLARAMDRAVLRRLRSGCGGGAGEKDGGRYPGSDCLGYPFQGSRADAAVLAQPSERVGGFRRDAAACRFAGFSGR